MKTTHYLCDTLSGVVSYAGELPETWGALVSLPIESDPDLLDLSWAGHPNQGFLTYQQAIIAGIEKSTLDKMRVTVVEMVWREIKELRDKHYLGGVKVGGKWFHSDEASRAAYIELKDEARDMIAAGSATGVTMPGSDGKPRQWKTMDGSKVDMTCKLAFDIVDAVRAARSKIFDMAEDYHMKAAESADPVLFDFSRNWPTAFAG